MRGEGGAGLVRGGCMGFSLLGLVVGIGLTVWLGSMALGGSDSPKPAGSATPDQTTIPGTEPTTTARNRPTVAVGVTPATGLGDDPIVVVTSSAFPAGAPVTITTCLNEGTVMEGDGCDPATATEATVDGAGKLSARYRVARLVTVGGTPFDCASGPEQCRIEVAVTADAAVRGRATVTFRDDLGNPPLPGLDDVGG